MGIETKKIKNRANLKGQLTRYQRYLSELEKSGDGICVGALEMRYRTFANLMDKYDSIQSEIETSAETEEELEQQEKERSNFETEYLDADLRFVALLNGAKENSSIHDKTCIESASNGTPAFSRIRLPKLELPKFDGKLTDYRSFLDRFKSLVHDNPDLSPVDKYMYLSSCLCGDALKLIQNLPATSANYDEALQLLDSRYNNTRCIKYAHLKLLFDLPEIRPRSAKSLRLLLDTVQKQLSALRALNEPVQEWDTLVCFLIVSKLDTDTRRQFEIAFSAKREPTYLQLIEFLGNRCSALERCESTTDFVEHDKFENKTKNRYSRESRCSGSVVHNSSLTNVIKGGSKCFNCQSNHSISRCPKFIELTPKDRYERTKTLRLCLNCLRPGHMSKSCTGGSCVKCAKGHHSLLHFNNSDETMTSTSPKSVSRLEENTDGQATTAYGSVTLHSNASRKNIVLLFTAIVKVYTPDGVAITVRALVDPGSQVNFIAKGLLKKLNIRQKPIACKIDGIGEKATRIDSYVDIKIHSNYSSFVLSDRFLVLTSITKELPQSSIKLDCDLFENLNLDDPYFYRSSNIELLLSNEIFVKIMKSGKVIRFGNGLKALDTEFGYLIGGALPVSGRSFVDNNPLCSFAVNNAENFDLRQFWELEDLPSQTEKTHPTEQKFIDSIRRDDDGRFVVKLPFIERPPEDCRYSRSFALCSFRTLERRFERSCEMREDYDKFMSDYLTKGFIEEVPVENIELRSAYYLPHHGVVKKDSLTTRLRVVFSGKDTTKGCQPINMMLETGPKLQNDLVRSLLRFRMNPIAFSADIEKMYCQIRISQEHRDFLRFFYRFGSDSRLREYRMISLPFGLNCSPFIAIRCLKELGRLNIEKYPLASSVIIDDSYVDDILSGSDNLPDATELCRDLMKVCADGGFFLRKWRSNSRELLDELNLISSRDDKEFVIDDSISKVLGMKWDAEQDVLSYTIDLNFPGTCTKRNILSWIARIFDPLGLLNPILITGKILIQKLWVLQLGWDEKVPAEIEQNWTGWIKQFPALKSFRLSRFLDYGDPGILVAFCDASEKAYGCCMYLVSKNSSKLIYAKSRVAPVKIVSLARLELCAAVLCSRAALYLSKCLCLDLNRAVIFTDSKIVLSWISKPSYSWKTFVANRVSEIQSNVPECRWRHISSSKNPADIVSRGMYPEDLVKAELWWNGPADIHDLLLVEKSDTFHTDQESKRIPFVGVLTDDVTGEDHYICRLLSRKSSLNSLYRINAWVRRFISNIRANLSDRNFDYLSVLEIEDSACDFLKFVQKKHLGETIRRLKSKRSLKSTDPLIALDPFLDDGFLIRVGGRLQNSDLTYDQKHPLILPKKDSFTNLIIRAEHIRYDHLGAVGLMSNLRQKYWIINSRSVIRSVLRNCFRCFKTHPHRQSQLMGSLPVERTTIARAFFCTGIDLCGPFMIRPTNKRGNTTTKGYVALFICMSTTAVHLETVYDLSSESFLAALRRFCGRRGLPQTIYTDNATNFVGVRNILNEWFDLLSKPNFRSELNKHLLQERITWKFIPPRTPTFGGLWESHIKSFKRLFTKTAGDARLSFEEFNTLLTQIEASLNSRPLCGVTESADDLDSLTPGHLLIGTPMKMLPCPSSHGFNGRLSKRWLFIQGLYCTFWNRWSREHLQNLQRRSKNRYRTSNLEVGDIGLVVDDLQPPLRWKLGRIIEVIYGKDHLVRVLNIKTENGVLKRGIRGFCKFDFATMRNGGENVRADLEI